MVVLEDFRKALLHLGKTSTRPTFIFPVCTTILCAFVLTVCSFLRFSYVCCYICLTCVSDPGFGITLPSGRTRRKPEQSARNCLLRVCNGQVGMLPAQHSRRTYNHRSTCLQRIQIPRRHHHPIGRIGPFRSNGILACLGLYHCCQFLLPRKLAYILLHKILTFN